MSASIKGTNLHEELQSQFKQYNPEHPMQRFGIIQSFTLDDYCKTIDPWLHVTLKCDGAHRNHQNQNIRGGICADHRAQAFGFGRSGVHKAQAIGLAGRGAGGTDQKTQGLCLFKKECCMFACDIN
eukprot:882612_1